MKPVNIQQLMKDYFRRDIKPEDLDTLKKAIAQNERFRKRFVDECLAHEDMCKILIEKVLDDEE